jgi:hypothetical protein
MLIRWHEHDFTVPFFGHLMCSGVTCAEVVTTDGRPLTDDERDEITGQMVAKYLNKYRSKP